MRDMKTKDILAATPHTEDWCAVFKVRGRYESVKYCRLMTADEKRAEDTNRYSHIRRKGGNSAVSIVFVRPVDEKGQATSAHDGRSAHNFQDVYVRSHFLGGVSGYTDTKESDTVPAAHILECVNSSEPFADYINREFSELRKRREASDRAEKRKKEKAESDKKLMDALNGRIASLVGESPSMWWVKEDGDVEVPLRLLASLVDLAEKAGKE